MMAVIFTGVVWKKTNTQGAIENHRRFCVALVVFS